MPRRRTIPRRPSNRQIVVAVIALITTVASCVDHYVRSRQPPPTAASQPAPASNDASRYDRRAGTVTHVVDGDTLDVALDNSDTVRVRLLGVDAPETRGPSIELGKKAEAYVVARADGKPVTLRLDELSRPRDKYGRLVAYVYLGDGELLNDAIVRDGWAYAHREYPCDFSGQFEASENAARAAKRGLWRTVTVDQMPEWRQQWLADRGLK